MLYRIITSLVSVVFTISLFSQIPEGLNLTFPSSDVKKLEKSLESFNQANQGYEKAVSIFKSVPQPDSSNNFNFDRYYAVVEDAMKELKSASEDYQNATVTVYEIYKEGADAFWKEQEEQGHYALGLEKAKYLEVSSKKNLSAANIKRALAQESREFQEALGYINEANRLEALVLRDQGRALQIYQDFPVEYEYGWDDDIDIKAILAQQEADRKARNEKLFGKHKVEVKKENEPEMIDREEVEKEPAFEGEIIYHIQIAAHTGPLGMDYLTRIYRGGKEINEKQEDGWYKYQIGSYKSFSTASDELKAANVERAFLVAYHDGARINIKEARKWAP